MFALVTALGIGVYSFVTDYRATVKANGELTTENGTLKQTVEDLKKRTKIDNTVSEELVGERADTQSTNEVIRKETFNEYFNSGLDSTAPVVQFPTNTPKGSAQKTPPVSAYTPPDVALRKLIDGLQLATCKARSGDRAPSCTGLVENKVPSK